MKRMIIMLVLVLAFSGCVRIPTLEVAIEQDKEVIVIEEVVVQVWKAVVESFLKIFQQELALLMEELVVEEEPKVEQPKDELRLVYESPAPVEGSPRFRFPDNLEKGMAAWSAIMEKTW